MNLNEKRKDAAHTLVVPYDATPEMVNQAYERRLTKRFHLQNIDEQSFHRGNAELYDARIRMSLPNKKQWLAQLRLMATSSSDKMIDMLMVMLRVMQRDSKSNFNKMLIDELFIDIPKMQRKYNILRGVYAYEITGLLSMMVYNQVKPHHNPITGLIVYGSMLIGGFAIGFIQDSINRSATKISAWSKLLSYDKFFESIEKEK